MFFLRSVVLLGSTRCVNSCKHEKRTWWWWFRQQQWKSVCQKEWNDTDTHRLVGVVRQWSLSRSRYASYGRGHAWNNFLNKLNKNILDHAWRKNFWQLHLSGILPTKIPSIKVINCARSVYVNVGLMVSAINILLSMACKLKNEFPARDYRHCFNNLLIMYFLYLIHLSWITILVLGEKFISLLCWLVVGSCLSLAFTSIWREPSALSR